MLYEQFDCSLVQKGPRPFLSPVFSFALKLASVVGISIQCASAALAIIKSRMETTLTLNGLKSFAGASWKENKALFCDCTGRQRQGRGIVLSRRGCLLAISSFVVSLSRPAETTGGLLSSVLRRHRRLMGEQLDVPLSQARLHLPGESGSSGSRRRGEGGGPQTACPEGTYPIQRLTLVYQHSPSREKL